MEKLPLCRVCLAENVRMYMIVNKNLRELYEKLTENPFVTEDSRPMLVCFFCCTKLKQCYQFQKKCLEAEEQFTQMENQGIPLIIQDHSEFCNGLIQTSVELISIVGKWQTENIAIKEELPAVSERLDDNIEPQKEHQSDELELENQESNVLDIEDIPTQHSESDSEDDESLMEFKIDVEEHEVMRNKRRGSDTQQLELDNVDKSYPDVENTSALHADSDSEDVPLMEVQNKAEDVQDSIGAPAAKKPKLDTRRPKLRDTISAEQKKNECNRKLSPVLKIIMKSQNHTSSRTTKFKKPFPKTQHGVCGSLNNTALSTSFGNNSDRHNIKCKISNKDIDSERYRRVRVSENRFECDISQHSFHKECNLISHTRTHTDEKAFNCDICQRSFKGRSSLVSHIRTHTGEKPFICGICQRSFKDKSSLVSHTRTHTGEKPFHCDICQSSFKEKSSLVSHTRTHTGEKPFNCGICQRSFSQKIHLVRHTRTHTGKKPFNCDICQRSFKDKSSLVSHTRTHTGEKPFNCDICQRSFKDKSSLVSHTRTHTGEKPFNCDICQRSYKDKSSLVSHTRTHTGEKPFNCDICQRSYKDKSSLVSHTRTHTGEKPFNCDICQHSFKDKSSLVNHTRTHSGEKPFNCDICQRSFSQKIHLVRHTRTHTGGKPFK